MLLTIIGPLNCRGLALFFCLDTKVTKKSSQQGAFFAAPASAHAFVWPLPCKPGITTGCNYFAPLRMCPMLLQKLAMPLQPHKATIVLPAFSRSLPADEEGKRFRTVRAKKQEKKLRLHERMDLWANKIML
ncbi:hypothetical protein ABID99_001167 [Mucilaginibacter sp. OAE612]|uniref:hypothetical protein n=1 Tax=Mucilaginibacter sp. OAE612 TaxID=3156444 RepID=UPI00359F0AFE